MRKVNLTMKEDFKYNTIKKLVDTNGNKDRAALTLDCSRRTINRLIVGYKAFGKEFFVHGNRNRKPVNSFDSELRSTIVGLYLNKYYEANFVHFSELLEEHENIKISPTTIGSILFEENILSPRATKTTKLKLKNKLNQDKEKTSSKKEKKKIDDLIVDIDTAHPRRPRCSLSGEMIQMDASVHPWFGNQSTQLHLAIDDATGLIVGAHFDTQETLNGYYNVLYQILNNYGIPYMFYTDRRTVFEYKRKASRSIEKDTFTQFGYACKQLGIDIKTTSIPQAKGRVERCFQTLQSRLPIELRLANVTTLEEANVFLKSYLLEYNKKFALPINSIKSTFEKQPSEEKINEILSVITLRKIDSGHSIKYKNQYYFPVDMNNSPVHFQKGTECLVINAFDNTLYTSIKDSVYLLKAIPKHETKSQHLDYNPVKKKEPVKHIPSPTNPWRKSEFLYHIDNSNHDYDYTFEEICNTTASVYG